ncbi:MAG: isoprenyl transferase [Acidobacteria bacterium]|nr:isoprenyl transferase [Acidobacteriota bacterium]
MRHLDEIAEPGAPERAVLNRIDPDRLPRHVAVIMDGNGRWAKARRRPRVEGHRAGIQSVREIIDTSSRLGIEILTLYAFSTENWKRPRYEVITLMALLKEYLRKELHTFLENNLRFRTIGRLDRLDASVRKELDHALEATARCTGPLVQIALNYSGRQELTDLVRQAAAAAERGELRAEAIDEEWIGRHLDTGGIPDPDLLIRTSGEQRISNFLLWQLAYTEIYFTPVLWPDFRKIHLLEAILDYQQRERRFGGLSPEEQGVFMPTGDVRAGT